MNKSERSVTVNEEGLTQKEAAFAMEYLVDLNKTQAYMRAYPDASYETAMANSSKIFKKESVQNAINREMEARAQRTLITADRVIHELAKIGFADIRNIFSDGGGLKSPDLIDDNTSAAISSIEVITKPCGDVDEDGNPIVENIHKIRLSDKQKALELLGKHLVLFTDKTKIEGEITHHTGVLVAPSSTSIDEWSADAENQQGELKKSVTDTANS